MAQSSSTYSIFGQFLGVQGIVSGFSKVSQASQQAARTSTAAWNAHGNTLSKVGHAFQRFYGGEGMFLARNILRENIASMKEYADEAQKLAQAQFKFRVIGLSEGENQRAFRAVADTVKGLKGLRIDEVTETITDLHTAFGDLDHAMEHLNLASKFRFGMSTLMGDKFSPQQIEQQIQNGFKFLEVTGATLKGADEVERRFDAMSRMMAATGGRVLASDLLVMARRAGPALGNLNAQGLTHMAAPLQEMGAARTGSALMSLYQGIIGGRVDKSAMAEFQRLGMLGKTSAEQHANMEFSKHGDKAKKIKPGAFGEYGEALMRDPLEFADMLMTAMKSPLKGKAVNTNDMMKVRQELAVLFGNRMAQQLVNLMTTQRGQIVKEAKLVEGAKGIEEMYTMALDTPMGKIKAFEAEMENLKMTLGGPLLGAIAAVAKELQPFIRLMGQHPMLTMFGLGLIKLAMAATQFRMAWVMSGMGGMFGGGGAAGAAAPVSSGVQQWNALFGQATPAAATAGRNTGAVFGKAMMGAAAIGIAVGIPLLMAEIQKLKDQADEAWSKAGGAARGGEKTLTKLLANQSLDEARKTEKRNVEQSMAMLLGTIIPHKPPEDEGWGAYLQRHLGLGVRYGGESRVTDYSSEQMGKLMQQQMPGLARPGQMAQAMQYVQNTIPDKAKQDVLLQGMAQAFPQAYAEVQEALKKAGGDYFTAVQQLVQTDQDIAKRLTAASDKTIEQFYAMGDAADRAAKRLEGLAPNVPEGAGDVVVPLPPASKHARGGISRRPTFGLFGEAGPEALIPLNALPGLMRKATSGGPVSVAVHNHFSGAVDTEAVKRATMQALREGAHHVRAALDERARDREQMS